MKSQDSGDRDDYTKYDLLPSAPSAILIIDESEQR
jgi:hypothetical protein